LQQVVRHGDSNPVSALLACQLSRLIPLFNKSSLIIGRLLPRFSQFRTYCGESESLTQSYVVVIRCAPSAKTVLEAQHDCQGLPRLAFCTCDGESVELRLWHPLDSSQLPRIAPMFFVFWRSTCSFHPMNRLTVHHWGYVQHLNKLISQTEWWHTSHAYTQCSFNAPYLP
jgi:hypothetical protein